MTIGPSRIVGGGEKSAGGMGSEEIVVYCAKGHAIGLNLCCDYSPVTSLKAKAGNDGLISAIARRKRGGCTAIGVPPIVRRQPAVIRILQNSEVAGTITRAFLVDKGEFMEDPFCAFHLSWRSK